MRQLVLENPIRAAKPSLFGDWFVLPENCGLVLYFECLTTNFIFLGRSKTSNTPLWRLGREQQPLPNQADDWNCEGQSTASSYLYLRLGDWNPALLLEVFCIPLLLWMRYLSLLWSCSTVASLLSTDPMWKSCPMLPLLPYIKD